MTKPTVLLFPLKSDRKEALHGKVVKQNSAQNRQMPYIMATPGIIKPTS